MNPESKTCTHCHQDKPLSEFYLVQKKGCKPYRMGYCNDCRRKKTNERSKVYYQENIDKKRAYEVERRKNPYYNTNHREYKKNQIETLTDGIVASWLSAKLKIPTADIYSTPGLIEAERTRLLLNRKIKSIENADPNFRVCSHCLEKKTIEDFRLRTEKRFRKEPYTYRSGQCKKCESIIKNSYGKK